MAAEWYYTVNQQQAGPVELARLQQMVSSGTLGPTELVFGPGLAQWTPAAQVSALSAAPTSAPSWAPTHAPVAVAPVSVGDALRASADPIGTLSYRGVDSGQMGISIRATDMLRSTKPWVRFMSIMIFIGAGLMVLGGLAIVVVGAMGHTGMPAFVGLIYLAMAALYIAPAIFLSRYASRIGDLMRSQRMYDLEAALEAQKSFWKFVGVMMMVILIFYVLILIVAVIAAALR